MATTRTSYSKPDSRPDALSQLCSVSGPTVVQSSSEPASESIHHVKTEQRRLQMQTSGKSHLTLGCITTAHWRFSRIHQVAPMCTPSNTWFLGPTRSKVQNSISIGSAVFAQLTAESAYTLQHWAAYFPSKLPHCMGNLDSHQKHGSLGPPESTHQMVSRLVQPFLQRSRSSQTDRLTAMPLLL